MHLYNARSHSVGIPSCRAVAIRSGSATRRWPDWACTEPHDGDLVVAEIELDDDAQRVARRYFRAGDAVRLEPVGGDGDVLLLPESSVLVLGVIASRLRFAAGADQPPLEEPLQVG
jgi:hypothetical protein